MIIVGKKIKRIIKFIRYRICEKTWTTGRGLLDWYNRRRLVNNDFTLISRNCIGGVIYHTLGKKFMSPTIDLFMSQEDFIKFVCHLESFMKLEILEDKDESLKCGYPVAKCGELTIYFVHYNSFEEAKEKWDRRKIRINYEKIFLINTDQDDYSERIEKEYSKLTYPKVLFVHTKKQETEPYHYYIKGFEDETQIGNILDKKNKFGKIYLDDFDYVSFLNRKR